MTGSPLDGVPWWLKVIALPVLGVCAVVDKVKSIRRK